MTKRRLTRQQRNRIHQIQELRRRRALERAVVAEQADGTGGLGVEQEGRVIANFGASLLVGGPDGPTRCVPRQNMEPLVAGDRVVWQPTADGGGVVVALLPRRTVLVRHDAAVGIKPLAANVDLMVVVVAPRPPLDELLLDTYLVAAESLQIQPAIVVNKIDLLDPSERQAMCDRLAPYRHAGYQTILVSSRSSEHLDALVGLLEAHTSILVGQSGVGKSSLVKALLPDLEIRIQALSALTGLGTHTTTTTTYYPLPQGGALIDSPGVRAFGLWPMDARTISAGFVEFRPYLGRCRFGDCSHRVEPGCALRAAVASGAVSSGRFANYGRIVDTMSAG